MNTAADETYCAGLVRDADFDRYAATLFAPAERRAQLLSVYAFNAEIAGVRDHVTQPLAGEVRLQWWSDVLSGKSAEDAMGHPVAAQLLQTVRACALPPASLDDLVAAHRFDLYDEPMLTRAEMEGFLDQTAGRLFALGTRILTGGAPDRSPLLAALTHHASLAHGLTSLLEAVPRHAARRQLYVPLELLDRAGVKRDELFAGQSSIELTQLMQSLAGEAANEFAEAMRLMPGIDPPMRPSYLLLGLVPLRLRRLARDGYDPFRLVPLSRLAKLWALRRFSRALRRL